MVKPGARLRSKPAGVARTVKRDGGASDVDAVRGRGVGDVHARAARPALAPRFPPIGGNLPRFHVRPDARFERLGFELLKQRQLLELDAREAPRVARDLVPD